MSSEIRMLLAVVASVVIFYAWSAWFMPKPVPPPAAPVAATPAVPAPSSVTPATVAVPLPPAVPEALPVTTQTLETKRFRITFSNDGGVPIRWELKDYLTTDRNAPRSIDVVTGTSLFPLQVRLPGLEALLPDRPRYRLIQAGGASRLQLEWASPDLVVLQTYTFSESDYRIDMAVELTNLTASPVQGRVAVQWEVDNPPPQGGWLKFLAQPQDQWHPLYTQAGEVTRLPDQSKLRGGIQQGGDISWGGMENRYFLVAIAPGMRSPQVQFAAWLRDETAHIAAMQMAGAPVVVPAHASIKQDFRLFVGPKEIEALAALGEEYTAAIDYGWFSVVAVPILHALKFFYAVVHNYGIAIILLTVGIKLLLHPITKSSMKSMRKMQDLQPELKKLRDKFKDDRERLNLETMQLFKRCKVNPLGGCLPMVLQLPIYIALYRVLWNSVELYRAPFFWFYTDLSSPDPYYISPALLGVAFFLQQKLTPMPSADPAQRKMMMIMPLFFTAFLVFLPSGLVIYILVNTVFTVVQQWLMNRGLGFRDLLRGRLTPRPS